MEKLLSDYNLNHINFMQDVNEFLNFYSLNDNAKVDLKDSCYPQSVEKSRLKGYIKKEKDKILNDINYKIKNKKVRTFMCFIKSKYEQRDSSVQKLSDEEIKIKDLKNKLYDDYLREEAIKDNKDNKIKQALGELSLFKLHNKKYPKELEDIKKDLSKEDKLNLAEKILELKKTIYLT